MSDFNETLNWGKCKVVIDDTITIDTIVENSTNLETEQGEKKEATIEGGEVIATRYNRNKYTLTFQNYGKSKVNNVDGIVGGHHKVVLYCIDDPNNTLKVLTIPAAVINVQSGFTSEYGTTTTYSCAATRQSTGSSIVWADTTMDWSETTDEIDQQAAKSTTYTTLDALKAAVTTPNAGDVYKVGSGTTWKYYKYTQVNAD